MSESPRSGPLSHSIPDESTPVPSNPDPPERREEDSMDIITPSHEIMGPPRQVTPDLDPHSQLSNGIGGEASRGPPIAGQSGALSAAIATSAQQPKVVQTAFIHKLYR